MTDTWRGHEIYRDRDGVWRYRDTDVPTATLPDRACGHCGEANTPEGHDACLGALPGVINACCGHGETETAYVALAGGETYRAEQALALIDDLRRSDATD